MQMSVELCFQEASEDVCIVVGTCTTNPQTPLKLLDGGKEDKEG